MIDFETAVRGFMAYGVDRPRAEELARRSSNVTPPPDPAAIANTAALEKAEQLEVRKRFVVCGFEVYNLSQARASKQTPGLADLWLVHRDRPVALWWETKRQVGGSYSRAQLDFRTQCERCGVGYGTGDRYDAERWLVEHELARTVNGVLEPVQSLQLLQPR